MFYVLIFTFGLIVGSFLNVVIYRLQSGESMVKTRSHCPKCRKVLVWYELIPLVSFVIQRRKCRGCKGIISWQYPVVELATGALFVLVAKSKFLMINQAPSPNDQLAFLYFLAVASLLIVIFVYDLEHYIIPDRIIYPAIGIAFLYWVIGFSGFGQLPLANGNWQSLFEPLFSAFLTSAFFAAVFFVSKGKWLGFGDVKLAFFMGIFLGWPEILAALFFAFILGGIIGMGLIASGKKTLRSQVPFGPFLVSGTFIALFWGEGIANWYFHFLI